MRTSRRGFVTLAVCGLVALGVGVARGGEVAAAAGDSTQVTLAVPGMT